jgi:hypothetical protein
LLIDFEISVIGILVIIPEPVRNKFDYWSLELPYYSFTLLTYTNIEMMRVKGLSFPTVNPIHCLGADRWVYLSGRKYFHLVKDWERIFRRKFCDPNQTVLNTVMILSDRQHTRWSREC